MKPTKSLSIEPLEQLYQQLPDDLGMHSWGAGHIYPARLSRGAEHSCDDPGCTTKFRVKMDLNLNVPIAEVRPKCFICTIEATPDNFDGWCNGAPDGFFFPSKILFNGYTTDQKWEWVRSYLEREQHQ